MSDNNGEILQATFIFDNKSDISQTPSNYSELKETIKRLFNINENQLNNYDITYKDEDDKEKIIIDDDSYKLPQLMTEQIIFIIKPKDNQINDINEDDNNNNDSENERGIRRGKGRVRPGTRNRHRQNNDRDRDNENSSKDKNENEDNDENERGIRRGKGRVRPGTRNRHRQNNDRGRGRENERTEENDSSYRDQNENGDNYENDHSYKDQNENEDNDENNENERGIRRGKGRVRPGTRNRHRQNNDRDRDNENDNSYHDRNENGDNYENEDNDENERGKRRGKGRVRHGNRYRNRQNNDRGRGREYENDNSYKDRNEDEDNYENENERGVRRGKGRMRPGNKDQYRQNNDRGREREEERGRGRGRRRGRGRFRNRERFREGRRDEEEGEGEREGEGEEDRREEERKGQGKGRSRPGGRDKFRQNYEEDRERGEERRGNYNRGRRRRFGPRRYEHRPYNDRDDRKEYENNDRKNYINKSQYNNDYKNYDNNNNKSQHNNDYNKNYGNNNNKNQHNNNYNRDNDKRNKKYINNINNRDNNEKSNYYDNFKRDKDERSNYYDNFNRDNSNNNKEDKRKYNNNDNKNENMKKSNNQEGNYVDTEIEKESQHEKEIYIKNFKKQYRTIIDEMDILFFGELNEEEITKIIMDLNLHPSLTIFEAMNLIYRESQIIKTLKYYESKGKREYGPETDIFEEKYITYYNKDNLKNIIENYKIFEEIEDNKNIESDWLYIDLSDRRRKLLKDKKNYYNYLPILDPNSDNEEYVNDESIYSNNENELLYHSLFYKTLLCRYCNLSNENNEEENELCPLCPYAHNILKDFRIIYDYRDEKTISFIKILLENNDLFKFQRYENMIPMSLSSNFNIDSFKVHKCQLYDNCPNDYQLCPYYHNIEGDEQRRPPLLFQYTGENGDKCFDEKKKKYRPKKCDAGIFCQYVHNKNEHNYHPDHFRKELNCKNERINGKCIYYKTCYGIHQDIGYEDSKDEEEEEEINKEEIEEDEEIKEISLKVHNSIKLGAIFRCRKCQEVSQIGELCYFIECNHFLCTKCFKKIRKDNKKMVDKSQQNINLSCPFCGKELKKGKIIRCNFNQKGNNNK